MFQLPQWLTGFNFLMGLLAFVVMVGAALIILLSRGQASASETEKKRGDALDGLLTVKEKEHTDCEKRCAECAEELEAITAEHRAVAAIVIKDLVDFWRDKDQFEAEMARVKREKRVLELQLDDPKNKPNG